MPKSRIEAFTDAVIAIILTLLVLEIHMPKEPTLDALFQIGHKLIIYLISFFTLLIYWNNHHHLFYTVRKINGWVLWSNNLLILALTFFPFITGWIGEYPFALVPQLVYGVVFLIADSMYLLLVFCLIRANGKESDVAKLFSRYYKLYVSIALNIVALLAGIFIAPLAVLVVNTCVLIMWFIPEKKVEIYRK